MSIRVYFYKFSKRRNSTLVPINMTPLVTADWGPYCNLKAPTSITHPVLEVEPDSGLSTVDIWQLNYAYIPDFARWYYVAWAYISARWQASLDVDVLGSNRTAIGSYSGYVQRSSYISDGNVIDRQYPTLSGPTHKTQVVQLGWQDELTSGRYVVGVVAPGPTSSGSVSYYVMTDAQFRAFASAVFNNSSDWMSASSITEISTDLLKTLFNPFEYIVSVQWFPVVPQTISTLAATPLGWWSIPVGCGVLAADSQITYTYTITPVAHPQAATRGAYLNGTPYTEMELDFQPFGHIQIPADQIRGRAFQLQVLIDYISGGACLRIVIPDSTTGAGDGAIIASMATQVGVPIQLAGREHTPLSGAAGMLAQTLPSALSAASGSGTLGAIVADWASPAVDLLSNVADAVSTGGARMSSHGSNGSRAQQLADAYFTQTFWPIAAEDNAEFGRPLMQVKQISTIPGFIKMATVDVALDCTEEERLAVQTAMLSGFYYE